MKTLKKLILIAGLFYLPLTGKAWGALGHRIVGEIADCYLTVHAKQHISKIFGNESVAMASNWPDFIKSDTSYKYLSPWHYMDIRGGMDYKQLSDYLAADTVTDAYTKINFLVTELKNKRLVLSPATQQMYLRLLIHIVGDIHQPLHMGRPEDKGGNTIKVKWFSESKNLHQVWDSELINFQQLSYTEYANAINHTTKKQRDAWQKQTLAQWMFDTYTLTEKVYADIQPELRLDYTYNFKFIDALNDQLLKGGVHLAGVLNDIFD